MTLFKSRKFWLMISDIVFSSVLYFGGKYASVAIDDIKFLVITLQPVVLVMIGSLAVTDAASIKADSQPV